MSPQIISREMASRGLKLLHKCSLISHNYVLQLAQDPLCCQKVCVFHHRTISRFSTSNYRQLNEKCSANQVTTVLSNRKGIEEKRNHTLLLEEGYLPIYKFQYAPIFSAINKVKWHQLYLTSGSVPLAVFCSSIGVLPTSVPLIILSIGGVITSSLWIFGAVFSRVVGAVLLSPDSNNVCISYVDNKGQRQDDVFPVKDLVPISDLPLQKFTSSWWVLLQRYSEPDEDGESCHQPYKMFVQNYEILDKKRFMEAFGSLL